MRLLMRNYKSANGKILYMKKHNFNKFAEVFHKYLDMEESCKRTGLAT